MSEKHSVRRCDACTEPSFVEVTQTLLGIPGHYCRKHAEECAGISFTYPGEEVPAGWTTVSLDDIPTHNED